MDISTCRAIADQATTNAYWVAVPEGLFFGFVAAGWVIGRLVAKIRFLQSEVLHLNPRTATRCGVLSGVQRGRAL